MNDVTKPDNDGAFQRNMMSSFIQIATLIILVSYCLIIVGPFAGMIVWGIILAVAIYPLHLKLTTLLGGKQKWSATLVVLVGLALILGPGWLVAESSLATARAVSEEIHDGGLSISPPDASIADWPIVGEKLYQLWSAGAENLHDLLSGYKPQVRQAVEWLLHTTGGLVLGLLHFVVSIVIAGACLMYGKEGYALSHAIASRIAPARSSHMAELAISTIRSVTNGVLGVAMIQAVLAGFGFAIIGVPAAGILTVLLLVTSIIQLPAIVIMAPIIVWVFSFADPVPATIFAVYSIIVGLSDNVLKPLLLGRGVDLPVIVVLLGAIGGMVNFGVIGLFIGAVILGLGYRIIADWIWPADASVDAAADGQAD